MKMVHRRFIGLILLLAIVVVGDRLIAACLRTVAMDGNFRFARLYSGDLQNEVLFLGNSRGVNTFYAPSFENQLGVSCLNLSYNGLSAELCRDLLLDYLEHNSSPAQVIVEVTTVMDKSTAVSNLKPFWHESRRLEAMASSLDKRDVHAAKLSHLYGLNCEMHLRMLYYRNGSDQAWINRYTISTDLLEEVSDAPDEQWSQPDESQIVALRQIWDACTQRGIQCNFVIGPYLPDYKKLVTNYDRWKTELADRLELDTELVDLSDSITDRDMFCDRLHANHKASDRICELLVQAGIFGSELQD